MDRLRQVSSGSYGLSVVTRDDDGEAIDVIAPVTVTVVDGGGATLVDAAAPTIKDPPESGATDDDHGLTYEADAAVIAQLDSYTVTWTGNLGDAATPEVPDPEEVISSWTTQFEVCGGYLFEINELRAFNSAFANASSFPASRIRAARTAAEQRFETAAQVAFVPRCRRLELVGDGHTRLALPDNAVRSVRSVSVDGTALTAAQLAELVVREWGAIDWDSGWTEKAAVEVCYEHGYDAPPEPVRTAVMLLASEYLVTRALSSRATVEATDVGFFRLSVAGPDRPTGIPEVDQVIREFGRVRPRVA